MKAFSFFLFLILFGLDAFAGDILFLDINNAISEVSVVRDYMAQEKNHDKATDHNKGPESELIIVPEMQPHSLEFFSLLSGREVSAGDVFFGDLMADLSKKNGRKDTVEDGNMSGRPHEPRLVLVPSLKTYSMEKRQKLQDLTTIMNGYKKKNIKNPSAELSSKIFNLGKVIRWVKTGDTKKDYQLEDFLPELQAVLNNESFDFDRVFISGHHGTYYGRLDGVIGGEFFNGLSIDTLTQLLNTSMTTENVNSVILLGCQTAINKLMEKEGVAWAGVLPDSLFHFGFNESAPVKTDELNLAIIREILEVQTLISVFKKDQDSKITEHDILKRIMKIKRGNRYLGFRLNNKYYQYPAHFVE